MSQQNNSRASELGDVLTSGATGFTIRKRSGVGMVFHLFLMACLVMLGASLLVYYRSPEGCLLVVVLGISFGFVGLTLEKLKKTKEALEFMNALFSSALGKGFKCCFIVKTTGDIVFYNRPFQALFPEYTAQKTRTIAALSELYIPEDARQKLVALCSTGGTLTTSIRGEAITFELELIERPTGFCLIRGK